MLALYTMTCNTNVLHICPIFRTFGRLQPSPFEEHRCGLKLKPSLNPQHAPPMILPLINWMVRWKAQLQAIVLELSIKRRDGEGTNSRIASALALLLFWWYFCGGRTTTLFIYTLPAWLRLMCARAPFDPRSAPLLEARATWLLRDCCCSFSSNTVLCFNRRHYRVPENRNKTTPPHWLHRLDRNARCIWADNILIGIVDPPMGHMWVPDLGTALGECKVCVAAVSFRWWSTPPRLSPSFIGSRVLIVEIWLRCCVNVIPSTFNCCVTQWPRGGKICNKRWRCSRRPLQCFSL